tara:strand:- start:177 stop:512 length:336 start_codon:yes stop_codon:yes gene_type:complete
MKIKTFFFSLFSFLIVGCNSAGVVNLTDTRGNKYTFKNASVTCSKGLYSRIYCVGSAIMKDIGGSRFTTQFPEAECVQPVYPEKLIWREVNNNVLCQAADKLGKISPLTKN